MYNNKQPLERSGNIAVWSAKVLKNGKKIYNVSFENADQQRTNVTVFAKIAGYELQPDEILALASGKNVRIVDETLSGPKICTVVNRGIETKIIEKNGHIYKNHSMLLGVAFHKIDNEGKLFGYLCKDIGFFAESNDPANQRSIYLTPQDCFKLLDGLPVVKGDNEAFLRYIDITKVPASNGLTNEEKTYKTARLKISKQHQDYNFYLRNQPGSHIKSKEEEEEVTISP